MEFLVTMTTRVPTGTTDADVDGVRQREAARSRELVAQGHLSRLWRPPLRPGEWRTLGLFAADDADALEGVLASMPLRVWRTDVVERLSPHPNDPAVRGAGSDTEFLVGLSVTVPQGVAPDVVSDVLTREAQRARELSAQGHLLRLWRIGDDGPTQRILGLWNAGDAAELDAILGALPLADWVAATVTPLSRHPSDPATQS